MTLEQFVRENIVKINDKFKDSLVHSDFNEIQVKEYLKNCFIEKINSKDFKNTLLEKFANMEYKKSKIVEIANEEILYKADL
ncbi:hypothetical protein [Campylobacter sp. LR291e]|nr:hypothetical protein [Campylobacter sp. LR291e]